MSALTLAAVGCGGSPPDKADKAEGTEEASAAMDTYEDKTANVDEQSLVAGRAVYQAHCATCHDAGVNRAPQRDMLALMTPESIHRALTEGVMTPQAAVLSDRQKIQVAEAVSMRKLGSADPLRAGTQCSGDSAEFDRSATPRLSGWGFDAASRHFIPAEVAGVDRGNVTTLKLKWAFAFPNAVRARSQPAMAAGAIVVGSHDGTVYALDRDTGCVRWAFPAAAEVRTGIVVASWEPTDPQANPLVYFGDLIGNVYALELFTGKLSWREKLDEHPNATITAAPALHDGTLYVSISSLEVLPAMNPDYRCCTFRGAVVALDALSGSEQWRTHTIPGPPKLQGRNAHGTEQFGPSGAPVWNTPAIDVKRGQLYVGTGENYSSPASATSDAIFAIGLATGEVRWVFQATENDAWNAACEAADTSNCPTEDGPDFDFGAGTVLATGSDGRDYVLAGQKSGVQHALDPETGQPVWQQRIGRGGVRAGIHFGIAAYDGTLYVPVADVPDGNSYDITARPGMYAVDIATGEYDWQAPMEDLCEGRDFCDPGHSGAISVTPELVLAGSVDGHLRVYDADSGEVVWRFDTGRSFKTVNGIPGHGGAMGGGSAIVAEDGWLVANSGYGFAGMMPGNVLLVFAVEQAEDS